MSVPLIRAGTVEEAQLSSGFWAFVDLGFSQRSRSCGLLLGENAEPSEVTYGDLTRELGALAHESSTPLNLLLEAPLSGAFLANGSPTGRSIERRGSKTRYWYVGLGCSVLVASLYLIRTLQEIGPTREIRLFEGFVSFKKRKTKTTHGQDVLALREVVRSRGKQGGRIVGPDALKASPTHRLESTLRILGMEIEVPPVVLVEEAP